jgi:hypothetical protein
MRPQPGQPLGAFVGTPRLEFGIGNILIEGFGLKIETTPKAKRMRLQTFGCLGQEVSVDIRLNPLG